MGMGGVQVRRCVRYVRVLHPGSALMLDSVLGRPGSTGARCLDALARPLVSLGVRPNALTYAAIASGVGAAALFYAGRLCPAFAILLVSGVLDAVDGRVARLGGRVSAWGGVLDLTGDR